MAPEKIMRELLCTWFLETPDAASLGIHAPQHMADATVLTGGIHGLEDQQQGLGALGVEASLKFHDALTVTFHGTFQRCFLWAGRKEGRMILQGHRALSLDKKIIEVHGWSD